MRSTQALQRTALNVLAGIVDQYAVANTPNATQTQAIASAVGLGVGGILKVHQVLRKDRQPHPWQDLFADALLGSGGTIAGQVGTGVVMQKMQATANNGSGAGDTTYTGDAADAASGSTAPDMESYQYPEASAEDVA